jgi:ABC-2 type transport system ATP-binding protein
LLVARNLWRFFGAHAAVQGLDMDVAAGSAYGFVGANGAGKTTTLRLLATLDRPTAGSIEIAGVDALARADRVRPLLGFMPDPFELYDDLTVEEQLEFFAQAYRLPRRERRRRVAASIELARVGERRHQRCGALSKGWKQRVLLAKTLVHDPKLLLLDEPASGLDPTARIEFRAIVRELREAGKAIVVSSHILTELADFCDSVGIVERGRMLVSGKIDEILGRLDPSTRIDLEVVSDREAALRLARTLPGVETAEAGEQPLAVVLRAKLGEDNAGGRARLLEALVSGGVRVAGFAAKREGLEDLFLRVASDTAAQDVNRRALLRELLPTPIARPVAPPKAEPAAEAEELAEAEEVAE